MDEDGDKCKITDVIIDSSDRRVITDNDLLAWEQGRCKPSGAAQTLLVVAIRHPEVLREL